jgi:hypothetical protein
MAQPGQQPRLLIEATRLIRLAVATDHLHSHGTPEYEVARRVDDRSSPAAETASDLVPTVQHNGG